MFGFFEFESLQDVETFIAQQGLNGKVQSIESFVHIFTHFELTIHPQILKLDTIPDCVHDNPLIWFDLTEHPEVGLAAPTKKLVKLLGTMG